MSNIQISVKDLSNPTLSIGTAIFSSSDLSDKNFIYSQILASSSWEINHDLEKHPSVTIIDSGGSQVIGDVLYIDDSNITISFSTAFSGTAYLN